MASSGQTQSPPDKAGDTETTKSAAARVFGIAELRHEILLDLDHPYVRGDDWTAPILDYFTMLRVNKGFKATIEDSPEMRQTMRLDYYTRDELKEKPDRHKAGLDVLYGDAFGGRGLRVFNFFPTFPDFIIDDDPDKQIHFQWTMRDGHLVASFGSPDAVQEADKRFTRAMKKGFLSPEASWRKMKVDAQPSHREVRLTTLRTPEIDCTFGMAATLDTKKAVLGDLYQLVFNFKSLLKFGRRQALGDYLAVYKKVWAAQAPNAPTQDFACLQQLCRGHVKACDKLQGKACAVCFILEEQFSREWIAKLSA